MVHLTFLYSITLAVSGSQLHTGLFYSILQVFNWTEIWESQLSNHDLLNYSLVVFFVIILGHSVIFWEKPFADCFIVTLKECTWLTLMSGYFILLLLYIYVKGQRSSWNHFALLKLFKMNMCSCQFWHNQNIFVFEFVLYHTYAIF